MKKTRAINTARGERLELAYIYGGLAQYQAGEVLGPRVLPDWELVLVLEGEVTYALRDRQWQVPPGGVVLARPGFRETYQWDRSGPTRHVYFHFQVRGMPGDWPSPERWPVVQATPAPVIHELFRCVMARVDTHPRWPVQSPDACDCRLVEMLIDLFIRPGEIAAAVEKYTRPEPVGRAIRWMRELLDHDPRQRASLDQLSRAAGVSAKHLCRLFQHSLGHPPMHVLTLMRLQLSLVLLARSNLNISQIAHRCGFQNPFYFSRCFTRTFHRAPSVLREQLLAGKPPPASLLPPDVMPRVYW